MKTETTYTLKNISEYLKHYRYHPTYRQGDKDAFYNPRNRRDLLIPIDEESFIKSDIVQLFAVNDAADLTPELEWCRFELFNHSQKLNY